MVSNKFIQIFILKFTNTYNVPNLKIIFIILIMHVLETKKLHEYPR